MENQQNNIAPTLLEYRSEIDRIDQKIIDLLNQRMNVVAKVGKYKEAIKDRLFIRSAREADMIKNLLKKADSSIPRSAIVAIWRKIIASANILEQDIKIAVQNPQRSPLYDHFIKEYYGDFIEVTDYASSTKIISEIENNSIQLGCFSTINESLNNDDLDHWWINIANNKKDLKVFAKIPFIEYEKDRNMIHDSLMVVAIKEPEQSTSDKTLLTIELEGESSQYGLQKALIDAGLDAKIIKNVKVKLIPNITFYLVEVDGFFLADDDKFKELAAAKIKPHIKVIGHYPTPIIL